MIHYYKISILSFVVTVILTGCSGVGNPTTPLTPQQQDISNASQASHYLWSYNMVYVNPSQPGGIKVEIIPIRQVMGHWNALSWLEQGPCTDCVQILGWSDSGHDSLLFDVEITHPFDSPNLTGFDVRGIAMFNGSHHFAVSGLNCPSREAGDGALLNADGYTTLYNITTMGSGPDGLQGYIKAKGASVIAPDAKLNGYKRYTSPGDENTRNCFFVGDSITATYDIAMPETEFIFGYAVDASWAVPVNKPVEDPILDFPPKANSSEPWQISVTEQPFGQGLTDQGGQTTLVIDVYDHQGKASHFSPVLECTDVFGGTLTADWKEDGDAFARYEVTVENLIPAPEGQYRCLISVEDEMNAVAPDWLDITAYQVHTLVVAEFIPQAYPPVAIADASPTTQTVCEQIHFYDDGSHDPDGTIVKYEWDWDNDGVFDEEGSDLYHSWDTPGTYQVQFRVTDNDDSTDVLDEPLEIFVENSLPTAIAEASQYTAHIDDLVDFYGTGSHDNDCDDQEIVKWEWDWQSDGVYDVIDYDPHAGHTFESTGLYNVQLRVTDDEDGTDLLDEPLEITITDPGDMGWARTWGSTENDFGKNVALDALGNVYVAGDFRDTVDFDPSSNTDQYSSKGDYDVYLVKYNKEGTYEWARTWGGSISDEGNAIAIDDSGNVYVSGPFRDTVDFDPGPNELIITSSGSADVFLSKLDSTGTLQWVRTWGGGSGEGSAGATIDDFGNIYIIGWFNLSVDFDPGIGVDNHSSNGGADIFLSKFDSSGNFQWARTWGGTGFDFCNGVVAGNGGHVFISGEFSSTVDFDPGAPLIERTSNGTTDVFLSMFDNAGNFGWVGTWGGDWPGNIYTEGDCGLSVTADGDENVYVTGLFGNEVDFDPSIDTQIIAANGVSDVFVTKFDISGDLQWVACWGGDDWDEGQGIAWDNQGNVYITGHFMSTVDFDPGAETEYHSAVLENDIFLSKIGANGDFLWARTWGADGVESGYDVATDNAGNAYMTGGFTYGFDFDPGLGVDHHDSTGWYDVFLVKVLPNGYWY